jgi:hypothetical protein
MNGFTLFHLILLFLLSCNHQDTNTNNGVHCVGKLYYSSEELKKNDGRIDVEFNLSSNGVLMDKTDYDTGSKRNPAPYKFYFRENNTLAKIEWYSGQKLIHYEEYDNHSNIVKSIHLMEARGYSGDEFYTYGYDDSGYMISYLSVSNTSFNGKIIRSDSVQIHFTYNTAHTKKIQHDLKDNSERITTYLKDSSGNIIEEFTKKGSQLIRCDIYRYDHKNRMIFHGITHTLNDQYSTFTNHWEYEYGERNLLTKLKLYTNNILQYTLIYEYTGLEKLQVRDIPDNMFEYIRKN